MKVLVCGGRTFSAWPRMFKALDAIHAVEPITLIVQDCGRGAGQFAMAWATDRGVPHTADKYAAAWKRHMGKTAGPTRNDKMLKEEPALVLAFPRGDGFWAKGTMDLITKAMAAGIWVVRP